MQALNTVEAVLFGGNDSSLPIIPARKAKTASVSLSFIMDQKAVNLCVLICLVIAFLLGISSYSAYLIRSPVQALPGLVALILRDGALIFFFGYLYRKD